MLSGFPSAGDQTANLWWQLRNGLLPRRNLPDAAVVMIGTNDLGFLDACSRWEADDLAAVPGITSRRAPSPASCVCANAARSSRQGLAGLGSAFSAYDLPGLSQSALTL